MIKETQLCPCKNLRSHDMYFKGAESEGHSYSSGLFWCLNTQTATGPDGGFVDAQECIHGRTCFRG